MVTSVHDRAELAGLLEGNPAVNAYQLGDLDDFYWPYTTWYQDGGSVALIYHATAPPTLLAFDPSPGLLPGLAPLLPPVFYAHLSIGAHEALTEHYEQEPHGLHHKMALTDPSRLTGAEGDRLAEKDLDDILALYAKAYPGNWFDPRMLETGQYFGIRRDGRLVAIAGVHVWSPRYRVCSLGNVTTDPDLRGQGLGSAVVARLCLSAQEQVATITLNVKADNAAAIAVYTRLGFTHVADYEEVIFRARRS